MYVTIINEKGYEFEREKGRIYRRAWREQREGEMVYYIILCSQEIKEIRF